MTMDAGAFATALVNDPDMTARLDGVLNGVEGEAAMAAVSDFAQREGYAVSPGQAAGLRAGILSELGRDGEVGDDELEAVSGGALDGWDDGFQTGQKFVGTLFSVKPFSPGEKDLAGKVGGVIGGAMTAYATFMTKW